MARSIPFVWMKHSPGLTDKQIDAVRQFAEELELPAGHLLFREGQTEEDFVVVLEGAIEFSAADSLGQKHIPVVRIRPVGVCAICLSAGQAAVTATPWSYPFTGWSPDLLAA
jgi:hypothetical protein